MPLRWALDDPRTAYGTFASQRVVYIVGLISTSYGFSIGDSLLAAYLASSWLKLFLRLQKALPRPRTQTRRVCSSARLSPLDRTRLVGRSQDQPVTLDAASRLNQIYERESRGRGDEDSR